MTAAPFTQPVSGSWLKPKDIPGHLILITAVHEIGMRYDDLSAREKQYAKFDYADLDDPAGEEEFDVSDNHPGITNKLGQAQRNGGMVLGRITQAPSSQGQPAWVLGPYNEGSDDTIASAWLAAHPRKTVSQPGSPQAARTTASAPAATPSQAAGQVTVTPEMAALLEQIQRTQQG